MNYITNADIEERLGSATYVQLADDDGDQVADVGVVDEVRLAAEGEVNSYLGQRFQVPINLPLHADLADLLASITLDLAEYRLRLRRPPVGADAIRLHESAIAWLKGVAEGNIALPSATPVALITVKEEQEVAQPFTGTTGDTRLLSRNELAGF